MTPIRAAAAACALVTGLLAAIAPVASASLPVTLGQSVAQVKADVGLFDHGVVWAPHTLAGLPGVIGTNAAADAIYMIAGAGGRAVEVGLVFQLDSATSTSRDGRVLEMLCLDLHIAGAQSWITSHSSAFNAERRFGNDVVRAKYFTSGGVPDLEIFIESVPAWKVTGNAGGVG